MSKLNMQNANNKILKRTKSSKVIFKSVMFY